MLRYINAVFAGELPKDRLLITAPLGFSLELQQQIIARGDSRVLAALKRSRQYAPGEEGGILADIHARASSAFATSIPSRSAPSWEQVLQRLVAVAAGKEQLDLQGIYDILLGAPDPHTGQAYDPAFAASASYYLGKLPHSRKDPAAKPEYLWLPAALAMLRYKQAADSFGSAVELRDGPGGLVPEECLRWARFNGLTGKRGECPTVESFQGQWLLV